ncbi:MAG: arylsulfatase [Acidimicrobiales bacterium]
MSQKIGLTLGESTADRPPDPYRRGAPNVVLVVLDDCGFGQLGCFGGVIDTPHIDRLAEGGLRYTNFHTTAVCSPTRACALTGRNHHRVGMGMLPDIPLPFPGYTGVMPPEAATLPAILREEGWVTWAIGKWHLSPRDHRGPAGPFHTWPTGVGFDRYYGFLGGEDSQWTPDLVRDQSYVDAPRQPSEGYHFTEDIADEAIRNIRELRLHQPDRPFMMYWATGAPHSPHQVPEPWIEKYAGRFDDGWDVARERILTRQKELGIVPADVELSARPDWVAPWESLGADERRVAARLQEVFAGYLSHTDAQIGRIVDALEAAGELENTVVVVISDNGASGEGGPLGSVNHLAQLNNHFEDVDELIADLDLAGGHRGYNHYPWGWAHAGNTPLRRWKRYTFEGGVRDPLIIAGPGAAQGAGGIRHQYCHAIDLLPTVLDLLDVAMPAAVRGVPQMTLDGVSLAPTITDADAPEVRTSQYYECWGSRALYHEGWKVVTDHVNQLNPYERERMEGSADFRTDHWALVHSAEDYVEAHDLSDQFPDKRDELVERWWQEAERNQVLPLDDAVAARFPFMHMPYLAYRQRYELGAGERINIHSGPLVGGGFTAVASLRGTLGSATGTICEQGDWIAGWSWVVLDGEVVFFVHAPERGASGSARRCRGGSATALGLVVQRNGDRLDVVLSADGSEIGSGVIDATLPGIITTNGIWMTVGYSTEFPVADAYAPPFPLPVLDRVVIDAAPPSAPTFDELMTEIMRHQ